jgi:hypothetical protein
MGLAKNIKNVDNHSASFKTMRRTLLFTGGERNHSSSEVTRLFEKHAVEPSGATAC